jgi:hypothetical protein
MQPTKHGPGRPRKYGRPSRALTLTLPEDVIARLAGVDPDLGRAVVALVEARTPHRPGSPHHAELASYGKQAIIIVTPLKALKRLPGVQLVPVGNGRALISLESPHSIADLELAVGDAVAHGDLSPVERDAFDALAEILQQARRSRGVSLEERTIIVLEMKRQRRR